ncbi:MAG: cytochrome c oxidase subunit 3 [Chitinophagales bacterium]|nr:cytochrome c oxidase subunit 3 [Chitinophagales bacterium]
MASAVLTYNKNNNNLSKNRIALKMMLYIGMASITMFFAVTTSALLVKKADGLNWAQFPLPNIFALSSLVAVLSSLAFYFSRRLYLQAKFKAFRAVLALSAIISIVFLFSQFMGFKALEAMGLPLTGNVSGSFIYFLAITHGVHIVVGVVVVFFMWWKSYRARLNNAFEAQGKLNPNRVVALELLTSYWHFVNGLWLYLFLFFYFIYQ